VTAVSMALPSSLNDRATQLLDAVDYRLAEISEEKEAIYRLRYDAYLREGAIAPNSSHRFADPIDEQENCWIFGVYIDGALASAIRLSVTIPTCIDLPALHVFSDLLTPKIEAGELIVDPTRFVADRTSSRLHPELPYITLRLPWMAMEYFQADIMLATVRTEHQAFYKRLWGSQLICPARPYPGLDKPISLMTCDYQDVREKVLRRLPFFRSSSLERRKLFDRTANAPARTQQPRPVFDQPALR
jgi:hypothetical protein